MLPSSSTTSLLPSARMGRVVLTVGDKGQNLDPAYFKFIFLNSLLHNVTQSKTCI